jgi:two-component system alkaline phosphatase synthesis response regulator PhoP
MTTRSDTQTTPNNVKFCYQDAHLEIDRADKFVFLDSRRLALTRKEYELLTLLVENAGEVVPREVLLMRVWGYSSAIRTRTLDVHIRRLRKRLAEYSDQHIETIFGVGYRFQPFRANRRFQPVAPISEIALTA